MPRSKMKPRTFPSSHLAQTTAMSASGELVILELEDLNCDCAVQCDGGYLSSVHM